MRITGSTVQLIQFERAPYHWCDDLPVPPTTVTSPLLRIHTDAGLTGTCFGATDVVDAGIEAVKSLLVGEDPLNRERLWHRFWKAARWRGFQGKLGTVDVALWGLFGQAATLPVYTLLGGTATASRPMPARCRSTRLRSTPTWRRAAWSGATPPAREPVK